MTVRVGINGFRPHRAQLLARRPRGAGAADIEVVAANDLGDIATLAHLLKYDTVLGPLGVDVDASTATSSGRRPADQGARRARPGRRCPGATSASTS